MLGVHVIIDLSSHLSPVIQSVLLHRPAIVQVLPFPQLFLRVSIINAFAATMLRSIISDGWLRQALLG
jgi:hypothetical protein